MVTIWNCYFLDYLIIHVFHVFLYRCCDILWSDTHWCLFHFFSDSLDQPPVPCDFWEVAMAIDVFICWPCLRYWCWMNILSPCEPMSALMFLACTTYVLYLHHLNIPVVWSLNYMHHYQLFTCLNPALPEHLYCEQDDDILHVPRLQNHVRWLPYVTNSTYHIHLPA